MYPLSVHTSGAFHIQIRENQVTYWPKALATSVLYNPQGVHLFIPRPKYEARKVLDQLGTSTLREVRQTTRDATSVKDLTLIRYFKKKIFEDFNEPHTVKSKTMPRDVEHGSHP
jgi:hypothetical protein